jgi:hypothetical protein
MQRARQGDASGSARVFACARCGVQVLVCSRCDRGQRYCGIECAGPARRESLREAGRRYQASRAGRFAHARRARRYRQRWREQEIVTHHGCQATSPASTLAAQPSEATAAATREDAAPAPWHCHWCERSCALPLRRGFLRHGLMASAAGGGSAHGRPP